MYACVRMHAHEYLYGMCDFASVQYMNMWQIYRCSYVGKPGEDETSCVMFQVIDLKQFLNHLELCECKANGWTEGPQKSTCFSFLVLLGPQLFLDFYVGAQNSNSNLHAYNASPLFHSIIYLFGVVNFIMEKNIFDLLKIN